MVFFELFAHNPTIVQVAAGQPLFSEGEEGHMMFVLSTGTANVLVGGQVLETLQHGSIVGEVGIVLPGRAFGERGCTDGLRVCRGRRKTLSVSRPANAVFRDPGYARHGRATAPGQSAAIANPSGLIRQRTKLAAPGVQADGGETPVMSFPR
jgi:hypothetical protein